MSSFPCLVRSSTSGGETRFALGDRLVDSYLAFVSGRARANTLRAVAHDLKTFFGVVGKDPAEVVAADVFDFLAHQRGDRKVVRISDGESGLSARTIARRLSSIWASIRTWSPAVTRRCEPTRCRVGSRLAGGADAASRCRW
jgi:integrase/recombinase XerD